MKMFNSICTFISNKKEIVKEKYFKKYTYKDFMEFMDSIIVTNELYPIDRLTIETGNVEKIEFLKSPYIKINENGRYEFKTKFYFLNGDLKIFFTIEQTSMKRQTCIVYVNDKIKDSLNEELKELIKPYFFRYSPYFYSDYYVEFFENYKTYMHFIKKLMTLVVKLESEKRLLITKENI
ncbi:hypothetical protein D3C76_10610 [compost metagenome]